MISFIVHVYNSAKNLETCLFFLVNQTIKDLEIIHAKKINIPVDPFIFIYHSNSYISFQSHMNFVLPYYLYYLYL